MKEIIGITGASGMLGKHLMHILSKKKFRIISTSRKPVKYKKRGIYWKKLDLTKLKNEKQLDNIFEGITTIAHLGALVPANIHYQNKNEIKKTNFDPTVLISKWAIRNNIHLIYISGAIIYENKNSKKIKEDSKINLFFHKDYYGESKKNCDVYLQKKMHPENKITILRPTSIYGYGLNKNKIIMKLIRLTKLNKEIRLYKPFEKINLIHAIDVADAVYKSIIKKKYKIFNISSDKLYSIKNLSKILIKINKSKSKLKIYENIDSSKIPDRFNTSSFKAKKSLGWINRTSLEKGLKLIINKKYGK